MSTLQQKLNELRWTARLPMEEFKREGDQGFDDYLRKSDTLDQLFNELESMSREQDTLVGRCVSFPVMDGKANYVITHVLPEKGKVVVEWIDYDEAYIDDRLGERGILDLEYVQNRLEWEDSLKSMV